MSKHDTLNLAQSLRRITFCGCLALIFIAVTGCPAQTEFFRRIGATEFHFGLLAGIPMVMLSLQFFAAIASNHLNRRKPAFVWLMVVARFLYLPVAFLPLWFPSISGERMMMILIMFIAGRNLLLNMAAPLWNSWMADLIPHRILNRYWGNRQRVTLMCWTAAGLVIMGFTQFVDMDILVSFPILASIGIAAGMIDIILFRAVMEPPNVTVPEQSVLTLLLSPFRHNEYKTFVFFHCAWTAAVMFAAAFMQLYLLKKLNVTVPQATVLWCLSGLGSAISAPYWGKLADKHGHRPIMIICTLFKPIVVFAFLFITPATALIILPGILFVDGMWNAGNVVACNGYMMKTAPRENRSMYCAAISGLAGICGGLSAIGAGALLQNLESFSLVFWGRHWNNFHVVFAIGALMRILCSLMVFKVRESKSSRPVHVISNMFGTWTSRLPRFPIGFYRR